ncbi:hypothetical protein BGZ63DRAFT_71105 [Mariannaea sp. PMI_226]|nr:hypothetical protein BGZ63DRAFT_71105 [Mariannaea sp. PMI_226]
MSTAKNDRKRSRPEAEPVDPISFEDRDNGAVQSTKRARVEERRSLFVRSLPPGATSESLTDYFSEHFPVKHAIVVVDQKTKESRGYGFVTFADAEDAKEAKEKLDKQEWDGRRIRLDIAEPRHRNTEKGPPPEGPAGKPKKEEFQKPPKLIVRNLPWSIKTSEQLGNLFRSYGKVKFADLPQSKGKLKGFGFVTLRGKKNAERAVEGINGKEIDGRAIAVDFAVDKETWAKQKPEEAEEEQEEEEEEEEAEEDAESDTSSEDEDDEGGAKTRDAELDADLENFMKNHMENMEDEDEEDEEDKADAKAPPKRMTDNSATVFIRNLPFTTTDEKLKDFFDHFGKVRYARVVMDKTTDKPAGTGFVCFFNMDDAKECIKGAPRRAEPITTTKTSILQDESADPSGKYTLDGRLLQVSQAVSKEQATNLADHSLAQRNQKDKRRLFLLNEGQIGQASPLYDLMTQSEILMRQASTNQRRKMVQKNASLHLSLTRLALRNIPRNIGSRELKELARKAIVGFAKDVKEGRRQPLSKEENARDGKDAKEKEKERKLKGKGIVRQAKIVFESGKGTKVKEQEGGKSRGYGFIEFTSHHWALMCLRYLNGFPVENDAGKNQRLIVEFAIENAQVIQRRRAIEEKSRQPQDERAGKRHAEAKEDEQKPKGFSRERSNNGRGRKGGKPEAVEEAKDDGKPRDAKEDMKQKLIARKRLMRKKKAQSRGKN